MACRYTYNGKTYSKDEFRDVLLAMSPSEASKYMDGVTSVPDAPFIGSTASWSMLAFKRMIRFAAENGFDSISFTTGAQQAERYDLSKQAGGVYYTKDGVGKGTLVVMPVGKTINSPNGVALLTKDDVAPADLAEYIGKDVAEKLLASTTDADGFHSVEGLDLKIGGEGMKGFYDEILPKSVNKYVKKWGGRTSTTRINTPDLQGASDVVVIPTDDFADFPSGLPLVEQSDGSINIKLVSGWDHPVRGQGARGTSDTLGDFLEWNSLGKKTFSSLPVPIRIAMMDRVRLMVHDSQIGNTIVGLIPVDVMNDLVGGEAPAKVLLHNPSMLSDYLVTNANADVSTVVDKAMSAIVGDLAFPATEVLFGSSNSTGFPVEFRSTFKARDFHGHSIDDLVKASISGSVASGTPVHALDITPAMKQAAMAGQPMFSRNARPFIYSGTETNSQQEQLAMGILAEVWNGKPESSIVEAQRRLNARKAPDAADFLEQNKDKFSPNGMAGTVRYSRSGPAPTDGTVADTRKIRLYGKRDDGSVGAIAGIKGNQWEILITGKDLAGGPQKRVAKTRAQAEAIIAKAGFNVTADIPRRIQAEQGELYNSDLSVSDKWWHWLRFQAQDKLNDLKRVQNKVEGDTGQEMDEATDAYLAEELFHGKAEAVAKEFEETMVDPLLESISRSGYTQEQVEDYLYARHAAEANAVLKDINGGRDAMSGMSNEEATEILDNLRESGDLSKLERIGDLVDQITKARREMLVAEGLETQETIDAWEKAYQHYIPLKGQPGEKPSLMPRIGRGKETKGADSRRRLGRQSRATNLLANLIAQHNATIIRAEKVRVGRALLNFARENPDPNMWRIDKPEMVRALNPLTGLVESVHDPRYMNKPNVMGVRVDGVDHYITFNDENALAMRIATAMLNLGVNDSNFLVRTMLKVNRFLAAMNTSYNPEFVLSNFTRDLQTVAINLNDSEAKNLKARIIAGVPKAILAIRRHTKGKRDSEMAKWYAEFLEDGAKTGWIDHYRDIHDLNKSLTKKMGLYKPGTWAFTKRSFQNVSDFVENWNTAVENGIRLSSYMHARKAGVSRAKAASLAKNISVNFNRAGNSKNGLNAAYLFFNASIQGQTRIIQAMARSKKARRWAYGAIAVSVALDMANRMIGGDDDEGDNRYDSKIPWHVKAMNWVFMLPKGEDMPDWVPDWARGDGYIKIPMPYGYNVLNVMGQKIGKGIDNYGRDNVTEYKPASEAAEIAISALEAFNPIGSSPTLLQFVAPTAFDPAIQWAQNKNFAGIPLRPGENPFDTTPNPQYQQHFSGARGFSKAATEFLNDVSGGNEVTPGKINLSPELVDHMIDFIGGGLGRTVGNTLNIPFTVRDIMEGTEEFDPNNIPFARRVVAKDSEHASQSLYYERRQRLFYAKEELDAAEDRGDDAALRRREERHAKIIPLFSDIKYAEKALKALRKEERAVRVDDRLSRAEMKRELLDIRKQKDDVYKDFNRAYLEVIDR